MAQYQVYNGTGWVNICECLLNIKDSQGNWVEIDNCPVRYWTGTDWCLIDCIPSKILCGGSLDVQGADGGNVFYVPFTIREGFSTVKVTLSAFGNPDGFSIITMDKVTKLASVGLVGIAGVSGWNTSTGGNPELTKNVFLYKNGSFVDQLAQEVVTFYGEGVGDAPGSTPMSNTGALTMYNPGEGGNPFGTPIPTGLPEPSLCTGIDPAAEFRCYDLIYNRGTVIGDGEVLIQVVPGNFSGSGWTIFNVECLV